MTKVNVNTDTLDRDLIPYLDKALDSLNKAYEISTQLVAPEDYAFISEIEAMKHTIEKLRNITRDYDNSYKITSDHFKAINNNLLLDIKNIKNINIFKK